MRRRRFIRLLGGAAAATIPLGARGQHAGKLPTVGFRHIGALFSQTQTDPEGQARAAAFRAGLAELGWQEGKNLQIAYRWSGGRDMRRYAEELVSARPQVILASATTALVALQKATNTIPIVFAQVTDPVGAGFVASLARPGGNITGLTQHEFSIGVKWLELLKQIAPQVTRAAILYDPGNPATSGYLRTIESAARTFGVEAAPSAVRDAGEIARTVETFAQKPGGGLVLLPGPVGAVHRATIIELAARHRLPAVYAFRYHVVSGGLASYGVDNIDLYHRAAWYVDRVLKGQQPGELPVQNATKFQLVINRKTASALGLELPITLLARTDEVIE